ncbi:VapE domain-containing protein [Pseudomonas sp. JS3066]|uniref:VapE domain-containing protein n=1 Tax=Pseudomonas sp. JS3066 TaxID=3090665 RepID=UPI002E7B48B8|nr:VapE domain-containing protein [Pseudomonas sp. JS3066]WVK93824.1 VapE domain-containing protein [Pseudomonas sp. JS3066]
MADDLLDNVLEQLQDYGLEPKLPLLIDKRTRCKAHGDKSDDETGWYVIYEHRGTDGRLFYCGAYGDWRQGGKGDWQKIKQKGRRISEEDRAVMKAKAERARQSAAEAEAKRAKLAARRAAGMFNAMPEKGRSDYLVAKQVGGFGVRYSPNSGAMLVPMRNVKGHIMGLQIIGGAKLAGGRNKTYWPKGMAKEGAFHLIGPRPDPGEPLLICEGYATGASLHMATSLTVAIAFDAGNLFPVAEALRAEFPGRQFVLCADDDWKTTRPDGSAWNPGVEKAQNAAEVVGGQVAVPVFDIDREAKWTDFNDLHCSEGLEAVRRQVLAVVQPATDETWLNQLHRSKEGLISHAVNVALILGNDKRWQGVIAEDTFSSKTVIRRTTPYGSRRGEWSDLDDIQTAIWLAEQYNMRTKSLTVLEGVSVVARNNQFHPVRDYLNGLKWDGKHRLSSWTVQYLGARALADDERYPGIAGLRWMVAAVARVMQPGVKADCVLIFEGLQGKGKSTALKILGGEWFMDSPFQLGDKEAFQQIRGKWIIELGELDAFNKAESTKAKQFFSASVDTFRASYARRTVDVPRQCVFAGTTNQDEYLKDATGNRRYWPVFCEAVDVAGLTAARDQLWAEAVHLYNQGEPWWAQPDEAAMFEAEQDCRFATDAWEPVIVRYLETNLDKQVTGDVLLSKALNLDAGHWGKPEQTRLGQVMHRIGWKRRRDTRPSKHGLRLYSYHRPESWGGGAQQQPLPVREPAL